MGATESHFKPFLTDVVGHVLDHSTDVQQAHINSNMPAFHPDIADEASVVLHDWIAVKQDLFLPLWTKYDKDKDGKLSRLECRQLTRDFIKAEQTLSGALAKDIVTVLLRPFKSLTQDLDAVERYDRLRARVLEKIKAQLHDDVYPLLLARSNTIADRMWSRMDENGDGVVEKHEFLKNYVEALDEVTRAVDVSIPEPLSTGYEQPGGETKSRRESSTSGGHSRVNSVASSVYGGMSEEERLAHEMRRPKEGWLRKRGGRIKTWNRRYFIIDVLGTVTYLNKMPQAGGQAKGSFPAKGAVVDVVESSMATYKHPLCFTVHVPSKGRTFVLSASSVQWRERFLRWLLAAGAQLARPNIVKVATPGQVVQMASKPPLVKAYSEIDKAYEAERRRHSVSQSDARSRSKTTPVRASDVLAIEEYDDDEEEDEDDDESDTDDTAERKADNVDIAPRRLSHSTFTRTISELQLKAPGASAPPPPLPDEDDPTAAQQFSEYRERCSASSDTAPAESSCTRMADGYQLAEEQENE